MRASLLTIGRQSQWAGMCRFGSVAGTTVWHLDLKTKLLVYLGVAVQETHAEDRVESAS